MHRMTFFLIGVKIKKFRVLKILLENNREKNYKKWINQIKK